MYNLYRLINLIRSYILGIKYTLCYFCIALLVRGLGFGRFREGLGMGMGCRVLRGVGRLFLCLFRNANE